jgi:hypothetical protein
VSARTARKRDPIPLAHNPILAVGRMAGAGGCCGGRGRCHVCDGLMLEYGLLCSYLLNFRRAYGLVCAMRRNCTQRSADAGALKLSGGPVELSVFPDLDFELSSKRNSISASRYCWCSGPNEDKAKPCVVRARWSRVVSHGAAF